jgi:N-acetylglutamate synthase-like GNAT family acetyltransferase
MQRDPPQVEWRGQEQMGSIRRLRSKDVHRVSALIQNTLLISNAPDYDLEVIGNLIRAFDPGNLSTLAARRRIWVYERDGAIQGTVGLEGNKVCNFFVAPDRQGLGLGQQLLLYVEDAARGMGIQELVVDSSLTAQSFYERMGYRQAGEEEDRTFGRTILMVKRL